MTFRDRFEAGRILASRLQDYSGRSDLLVLGLARGGVPVAFEVAMMLNCELDVFIVRKLGVPGHEELAMGAIASGGVRVLNPDVVQGLGISSSAIEEVAAREMQELQRRENAYRQERQPASIAERCVILVDDALATGSSMRAAIHAVQSKDPALNVVAVPVAPPQTCEELRSEADDVVCAYTPAMFTAVSLWYENFTQTSDEEVRELYERAARRFERLAG